VARDFGARVVATVHEYWFLCQRVMFQHPDGMSCPGPAQRDCVECVLGKPSADPDESRRRFETLKRALSVCRRVVTPSRFVVD